MKEDQVSCGAGLYCYRSALRVKVFVLLSYLHRSPNSSFIREEQAASVSAAHSVQPDTKNVSDDV